MSEPTKAEVLRLLADNRAALDADAALVGDPHAMCDALMHSLAGLAEELGMRDAQVLHLHSRNRALKAVIRRDAQTIADLRARLRQYEEGAA